MPLWNNCENCEIKLDLSYQKECITSEISITPRILGNSNDNSLVPVIQTTGATFQINNAKLYVPAVTLSIIHNIKFLENIKQGFKRNIYRNKYRFEITKQTKNLD